MTLSKHILRAAEFLRDLVARNVVRMQHLPGKIMVADLLTKAVARALFASLMDLIRQYAESGVACSACPRPPMAAIWAIVYFLCSCYRAQHRSAIK